MTVSGPSSPSGSIVYTGAERALSTSGSDVRVGSPVKSPTARSVEHIPRVPTPIPDLAGSPSAESLHVILKPHLGDNCRQVMREVFRVWNASTSNKTEELKRLQAECEQAKKRAEDAERELVRKKQEEEEANLGRHPTMIIDAG